MHQADREQLLGVRVKQWRLFGNLSQARLAARAGVSLRALRNLETGAGSTVSTLLAVLHALGCGDAPFAPPPVELPPSIAAYCSFLVRRRASPRARRGDDGGRSDSCAASSLRQRDHPQDRAGGDGN